MNASKPFARWLTPSLLVLGSLFLAGCLTNTPEPRITEILHFTATPNPVPAGSTTRLSWHAVNAASVAGGMSCGLVYRLDDALETTPAVEVPCQGTREITVNERAWYQLNVLKHPYVPGATDAYLTQSILITTTEAPQPVTVTLTPATANLQVEQSRSFTATITGTSDTRVTWGASCGTITGSGQTITYTAPGTPNTCTIIATSQADASATSTATVTVTASPAQPMLIEVDTNLIAGTTVTLPLRGTVNVTVDWGDGQTSTATSSGDLQHTYGSDGRYEIGITGSLSQFGNGWEDYPHAEAITSVNAWGGLRLTSLHGAYRNARNLSTVPTSLPATVTNLGGMFYGASGFNQPIGSWDTTNVTNMRGVFIDASAFNQPLNNWNTSNVTDMSVMFYGASVFNQPLDNWNTSNVTDTWGMFFGASAFNQPIGSWDTSSVASMTSMFANAASFNRDLSGWCVSLIPSRPLSFDNGATSWTLPRPVWGSCP